MSVTHRPTLVPGDQVRRSFSCLLIETAERQMLVNRRNIRGTQLGDVQHTASLPGRRGLCDREPRFVPHVPTAFGEDAFGRRAEAAARFFGTPKYIAGQTVGVIAWIAVNAIAVSLRWDPYPFILLNLAFSTQAAYAAPLILLAQTRQADRDKDALDHLETHREEVLRHLEAREAAIKTETDALKLLIRGEHRVDPGGQELDREDRGADTRDSRTPPCSLIRLAASTVKKRRRELSLPPPRRARAYATIRVPCMPASSWPGTEQ